MEPTLSIEDVARLLKYSKKTIYKLVKEGEFNVFKVGKCFRFDKKDISEWIEKKKGETSKRILKREKTILLVEDDPEIIKLFLCTLEHDDYDLFTARDPLEALKILEKQPIELIITDLLMPKMNGLEFISKLKELKIKSKIIILTGFGDKDSAIFAVKNKLFDYIEKPFEPDKMIKSIKKAFN